jgi:hypothetical protein
VLVKTLVNERKLSTKPSEHVFRSSSRKVCWDVSPHHRCQQKQSPFREEQDLPPQIQQALVLRAAGASWIDCAAGAGIDVRNLRKWRKHPQAEPFLNEQIRGNLQQAQTLFAEAAPKLAERLIKLGLDERVKGYTAVSAISEAFKILQTGVVDQQQREQIEAIKAQLTALEDSQTIDV